MSWLGLENKTVVVTGGAAGIGKAITEAFLANGAHVVVSDMNPNEPEIAGATEDNFLYVVADVTKKADVENAIAKAVERFGGLDVMINNAGINIPRLLVDPEDEGGKFELDERVWDKIFAVNCKGVFFGAQAAAREMIKEGKHGVIINMSSECGLEGSQGQSVYAASKAAVNGMTRSWCKELGKYGIRVIGIAPGIMEATNLRTLDYETALAYTRGITVEKLREGYTSTSTTPLGRDGKLTEVADTACFLASDRAGYIHGVTLNVAGGKTRG